MISGADTRPLRVRRMQAVKRPHTRRVCRCAAEVGEGAGALVLFQRCRSAIVTPVRGQREAYCNLQPALGPPRNMGGMKAPVASVR